MTQRDDSPGPGYYYKDKYFARDVPPITLKGKLKDKLFNENPGPGSYNASVQAIKDSLRSFNIGSS